MKNHTFWIGSLALCLAACSKQEPAEPTPAEMDQAAAPAAEVPVPVTESEFGGAFIDHMHDHAAKLDELMFALADGDLEGASTPAYWLAQHDTVEGVPEEWRYYVTSMRNAAHEVEIAEDLDVARAAAEDISAQCQACHAAAGVEALK